MSTYTTTDSKIFGAGYIYGLNVGGKQPSLLIPGSFATIQEASVDIAITEKELRGPTEDPEAIASASRKITGKVTTGRINLSQLNQFVFGEGLVAGSKAMSNFEPYTVVTTSLIVTPPNSGVFAQDLGVWYAGTRNQLTPVPYTLSPPVSPMQGEYAVDASTGTYHFNSSDETSILVSYRYTTTVGHTLTVTNQVMGENARPVFALYLCNQSDGDNEIVLFNCRATKLAFPIKREDFCYIELDYQAFANDSGQTLQFLSQV